MADVEADRSQTWLALANRLASPARLLGHVSALPLAGIVLFAALLALAGLRLALWSEVQAPPGSDGGNWLAFARELVGDDVKAATAVYPPVLPLLLRLLMVPLGALTALKVVGVASWALMGIPMYLILRRDLHPVLSIVLSLAFVMAGYQAETLAFGGYPQLLGTTFLLFSLYWLGPALARGNKQTLLLSAMAGSLAIGTHQLGATQLAVSAPIFAGYFALQQHAAWRNVATQFARWAAATAAFSLIFAPFYVRMVLLLDGSPANPHGYGLTTLDDTLAYVFLEQQALWLVLTAVALVVPLLMVGLRRGSLLAPTAAALLFGPGLIFALSGEVRSLQLMEAGVLVALGLLASYVIDSFRFPDTHRWGFAWPALAVGAACLAIALGIGASGEDRAQDSLAFYRVLDDEAVEALDWLRDQDEGVVIASGSPRGFNYGWWIEGYARQPAYNAADPRWFNFREETEQVGVANAMLSAYVSAAEVARLTEEHEIAYVFIDERTSADTSNLEAAGFEPAYENGSYLILAWQSKDVAGHEQGE